MTNRQRCFDIAWKIALVLLPWQTRVIFFTPRIAQSPWEQGTVAVRSRVSGNKQEVISLSDFVSRVVDEIKTRALPASAS